jgi:hypothetical protein
MTPAGIFLAPRTDYKSVGRVEVPIPITHPIGALSTQLEASEPLDYECFLKTLVANGCLTMGPLYPLLFAQFLYDMGNI